MVCTDDSFTVSLNENTKKTRIEAFRRHVFYFFERPKTKFAICYHVLAFILIIISLIISVLLTVFYPEEHMEHRDSTLGSLSVSYEVGLLCLFSLEYMLRLFGSSFLGKYHGIAGMMKFMRTIYMMIDMFIIISTIFTLILKVYLPPSYFSVLRIARFMQIIRILRVDRQRGDLGMMARVVFQHRKELITCYFVGFLFLFCGTFVVYICERSGKQSGTINNMADGLYWAMITVTSVGYGDFSPKTWAGKMFGGVFAMLGCAFFSLPAGILGSGFALQVSKQKKKRKFVKIQNPAAFVIQTAWRDYSLHPKRVHRLQGTCYYMFPMLRQNCEEEENQQNDNDKHDIKRMFSNTAYLPGLLHSDSRTLLAQDKHDSVGDIKFLFPPLTKDENLEFNQKKHRDELPSPPTTPRRHRSRFTLNIHPYQTCPHRILTIDDILIPENQRTSTNGKVTHIPLARKMLLSKNTIDLSVLQSRDGIGLLIRERYMCIARFLVRIRHFCAIKKFKNVRYPFVNVQDIMEKNTQYHNETIVHLKEIYDSINLYRAEIKGLKNELKQLKTRDFCSQTSLDR